MLLICGCLLISILFYPGCLTRSCINSNSCLRRFGKDDWSQSIACSWSLSGIPSRRFKERMWPASSVSKFILACNCKGLCTWWPQRFRGSVGQSNQIPKWIGEAWEATGGVDRRYGRTRWRRRRGKFYFIDERF